MLIVIGLDPGPEKSALVCFDGEVVTYAVHQRGCACIRWSARECYTARHYRPADDLDEPTWEDDDDCECRCHDELRQLEEDIYGPADERD